MERRDSHEAYRRIIDDTLRALAPARRQTTNLYVDTVPYEKGDTIGPEFQGIRARRRSLLVFADESPRANFGHDCRYRLYDAETQKFYEQARVRFPPFRNRTLDTLELVHAPVPLVAQLAMDPPLPVAQALTGPPAQRERYAILFSGKSDRRHLNDLEYCYRMLTVGYGFLPAKIFVVCSNMTMSLSRRKFATNWPEENFGVDAVNNDPYLMTARFFGMGDQTGFQSACSEIAKTLQQEDLVFIQISGHGDAVQDDQSPQFGESYLLQHDEQRYFADSFCTDLQLLGEHESLLVLMEQCFSNGFIDPLLNAKGAIQAQRLSIACASAALSFPTWDGLFNSFGRGWIASHLNTDSYGTQPMQTVDTDGSTFVEANEAYEYALDLKDAYDQPAKADSPAGPGGGEDIRLA